MVIAECSIIQCFSLRENASLFFECGGNAENKIPMQASLDMSKGSLVVQLKAADYSEAQTPERKTSLSSIVAALPNIDDKSNNFNPQEQRIGSGETLHSFSLYSVRAISVRIIQTLTPFSPPSLHHTLRTALNPK